MMGTDRSGIWELVHAERRQLVEDLEGLDPPAWETPSLCDRWSVHDVLAHLLEGAMTTRGQVPGSGVAILR